MKFASYINVEVLEKMRKRKEIVEEIVKCGCDLDWKTELLLDIRDLLIKLTSNETETKKK